MLLEFVGAVEPDKQEAAAEQEKWEATQVWKQGP